MLKKKSDLRVVEGYAKEDARYAVGLATKAQLGFTANARNLEYLIRCLRAHPLLEVQDLGEAFYRQAGEVAPSLILLTDPEVYEKEFGRPLNEEHFTKTHSSAQDLAEEILDKVGPEVDPGTVNLPTRGEVKLLDWTPNPDKAVLCSIIHTHTLAPAEACSVVIDKLMENGEADTLIKEFLRYSNPWEAATREFEAADFTFEVVLSAACYGQMKRHRMCTQLVQDYDPGLGYTYPPSVVETGLKDEFEGIYELTTAAYYELSKYHPIAAQYVLTNGHRRRMLVKANARELYHVARLREDAHAQWDIRQVSEDMLSLAREVAPLTMMLAWGKDVFDKKKNEAIGE
jgi:thymidylate synthase ThyX